MSFIQRIVQAILVGRSEDKLNVPSLPPPQGSVESLTNFARSVKTKLDVLDGSAGSGFDKAVTYRDLYDSGLLTFNGQQVVFGGGQAAPGAPGVLILGSGQQQEAPEQDLTPPPAPTGLMATGAFATILLEWNPPPETYKNFAFTEVFRNDTDNLGTAVKIGQTTAPVFSDPVGTTNVDRYYWIRFVSKADVAGDFNSVTGTVARVGRVGGVDLADAIVTSQKLASGAIQSFDVFGGNVKPIQQVDTLPNPMGYMGSPVVLLTTDGKLYRLQGGAWTAAVPTVDLTGRITNTQITDGAVTTVKLADASVSTVKIADNSISSIKLGTASVTTTRIADSAITEVKLGNAAVTTSKIGDNAITKVKFASGLQPVESVAALPTLPNATYPAGAVVYLTTDSKLYRSTGSAWTAAVPTADLTGQITTTQITDNAITTAKVAANAITANQIAANTITAGQIAANTITAAQIAANTITASQIASQTITAAQIASDTITANQIAANAITATELAAGSVTAGKIAANSVTATEIAANTITGNNIAAGTISAANIATNTISADKIATGTITAASGVIANAAITNALIANLAVDAAKIANGTITTAKIGTAQITTALIADAQITSAKIGDAQITNAKIVDGTILSAKIGDAQITTAKIANAAITNAKIADASITNAKIENTIQSNDFVSGSSGWRILKNGNVELNNAVFRGQIDVRNASSGARLEIRNNVIKVFDANGVLRVRIGDLTA